MVSSGRASSGLSNVPARKITKCGRASDELVTGVPQLSQNFLCIRLPLSAMLEYSRSGPLNETADAANTKFTVALPAARNWQSRHQQTLVAIGSATTVYRTTRHRQPPVIVIASPIENRIPPTLPHALGRVRAAIRTGKSARSVTIVVRTTLDFCTPHFAGTLSYFI